MSHAPGTDPTARPHGRRAVMDAVLDAATELFATRGPRATTIRSIAEHAGVNHALVHRYFGTKEELVRAVLARESSRFAELVGSPGSREDTIELLYRELASRSMWVRFLARAILDGLQPERIHPEFPAFRGLIALVGGTTGDAPRDATRDPRAVVAAMAAMALGWQLFEDFLLAALDLRAASRDALDHQVTELLALLASAARGEVPQRTDRP